MLRGERWGWLHVLHGGEPMVGTAGYALDRAADGIAIALLGARESGAKSAQRQNALVSRLLLGDVSGDAFVTRALRIGRDLRDRSLLVVFVCKETPPNNTSEEAMEDMCRALRIPAVVADLGEHTLAIMGLSKAAPEKRVVERLTALGVRAGVSRPVDAGQLPTAVEQARSAASVAAARPDNAVHRFDDLGVLRLLASLAGGPELARYIEDELGPVLKHDANATNPLLPTLRTYLNCDGNKSQAAQSLFVQRRTLYYRLERITNLLGRSLDEPRHPTGARLCGARTRSACSEPGPGLTRCIVCARLTGRTAHHAAPARSGTSLVWTVLPDGDAEILSAQGSFSICPLRPRLRSRRSSPIRLTSSTPMWRSSAREWAAAVCPTRCATAGPTS